MYKKVIKWTVPTIAFVLVSFYVYNCHNTQEDKGEWVKLIEDIPYNEYILHEGHIYGGYLDKPEDIKRLKPLNDIDVSSFEVCRSSHYARDRYHLYYPILVVSADGEDFGYSYFKEYIVKRRILFGLIPLDANPKHFKYLGGEYGVEGHTVYKRGEEVKDGLANP